MYANSYTHIHIYANHIKICANKHLHANSYKHIHRSYKMTMYRENI